MLPPGAVPAGKCSSSCHFPARSRRTAGDSAPSLTLMVSSGCPTNTRHTPPKPPAKKFFTGLMGCGCSAMATVDEGRETEPGSSVPTERAPPLRAATFTPVPGRAARWDAGGTRGGRERGGRGAGVPSGAGTDAAAARHRLARAPSGSPPSRSRFPAPAVPPSPPPAARGSGAARRPRPRPAEVTEGGGRSFRRAGGGGPAGGARGAAPCLPRPPRRR